MRLHRRLRAGHAAWAARDWSTAAHFWAEAAGTFDGDDRRGAEGLAAVAAALAAGAAGQPETGRDHLDEARRRLQGLGESSLGIDLAALDAVLVAPLEALLADPPPIVPRRRLPAGTGRFLLLVLLLVAGALAVRFTGLQRFLDREVLVGTLLDLRTTWWAPLALVAGFAIAAPLGLPVSPIMLAGGVVFGPLYGTLYNVAGAFLGAAISYQAGHHLGRQLIAQLGGSRLRKVERFMARHGFWGLVGIRFLPVPFPIVNYGAAFARVPFGRFLLTLAVALPPSMFVYTWFASSVFEAAQGGTGASLWELIAALALLLSLSIAPALWQQRQRRRRYAEIRSERSRRPS